MVVAGAGNRRPQQALMRVHGLDTAAQNTRNCMLSCGSLPGEQVVSSSSLIDQFKCLLTR
jgi:hypothetical protein